ncbi:hypothetical protein HYU06_00610 [Candidatus Woesearchaeota archaeon]|nr:hypothetical protein [Candidatus Woesearchaeota archaeon]
MKMTAKKNKNNAKKNSKKIAFYVFIALIIAINLSIIAYAASTDRFWDIVEKMYDFESRYEKNLKIWDFLLFSTIFNIIAWIGLVKAFPDNKAAAFILALVIGVALGLGAVKGNLTVKFFVPFVKNILFFIVMGIIFFVLIKFDMNKFLAFILALVITFVAFNVLGLFGAVDTGGLFGGKTSYDTYDQINDRLIALGNNYRVTFDISDDIAAKSKKLRVAMQREQGKLEEELKKNPNDKTAKSKLDQVIAHINELNELERKGALLEKEEEKKIAERAAIEYDKFRENLTEIKKLKGDTPEQVNAKFVDLKKLNDVIEEEEGKVKGTTIPTPAPTGTPTPPAGTTPTSGAAASGPNAAD